MNNRCRYDGLAQFVSDKAGKWGGDDVHLDGLLKGFNLPKYIVEAVVHAAEFGPHMPRDSSKEKREEDGRKGVLFRSRYPRQECRCDAPGQRDSVGTSYHEDVYPLAYTTVTPSIGFCRNTAANLPRVEEIIEIR